MATNSDNNETVEPSADVTGDVDEEAVENNFKAFRPYIETCVKVTDLIVFYDLFTSEQTKKFRQLFKTDPTAATAMAFDEIVNMPNQPDKYSRFLTAMKEANYPKIEKILKGDLIPVGSKHREIIKKSSKDIYQNLIPREILSQLLAEDVITYDDYEEITATEKIYSTGAAAIDLLTILPNRQQDWYKLFIESLIQNSHEHLAITIDKDFVSSIKKNEQRQYHGSCQPTYPAGDIRKGDALLQRQSVLSPFSPRVVGLQMTDQQRKGLQRRNPYIPMSWDEFITDQSHYSQPPIQVSFECSPCQYGGISSEAVYFCTDCTENLCEACKIHHSRMKITRSHRIVAGIPESAHNKAELRTVPEEKLNCGCDPVETAVYCEEHKGIVCSVCNKKSHENCSTLLLREITETFMDAKLQEITEDAEGIFNQLEHIITDRASTLEHFCTKEMKCRSSIMEKASKIQLLISGKIEALLAELADTARKEREKIENQIDICTLSNEKLAKEWTGARSYKKQGNGSKFMEAAANFATTLRDVKQIINDFDKDLIAGSILFESDEMIPDLLRDVMLGKLKLQ